MWRRVGGKGAKGREMEYGIYIIRLFLIKKNTHLRVK
jgi:hypothetical protein